MKVRYNEHGFKQLKFQSQMFILYKVKPVKQDFINNLFYILFRSMPVDQLNPVDLNLINDLWVPNVFIYNLKTFKVNYTFLHTCAGVLRI